jgi:hypothetical protein
MNKPSNSALAILAASRVGWVSCLGDDEDSAWRSVDGFYEGVFGNSRKPIITRSGGVWGKVSRKAPKRRLPKEGDGIAFYHSTRAIKPKNDRYKRKPRISLVGTLDEVHLEGRKVTYIKFTFDRHLAEALRGHPIVRDEYKGNLRTLRNQIRTSGSFLFRGQASLGQDPRIGLAAR